MSDSSEEESNEKIKTSITVVKREASKSIEKKNDSEYEEDYEDEFENDDNNDNSYQKSKHKGIEIKSKAHENEYSDIYSKSNNTADK